ncbi:uncharacterized protein, partial [Cicer arietinum]
IRWSLIAARLPGRTANDVKNYWHTHLRKKTIVSKKEENKEKEKPKETMKPHEIIKPQPRTFSSHSLWLNGKHNFLKPFMVSNKDGDIAKDSESMVPIGDGGDCSTMSAMWWKSLLHVNDDKINEKIGSCSLLQDDPTLELPNLENFLNEDPSVSDCYWGSNNPCEFDSILDFLN